MKNGESPEQGAGMGGSMGAAGRPDRAPPSVLWRLTWRRAHDTWPSQYIFGRYGL